MSKLIAFVSTFIALFLVIGMAAYFRYYAPVGSFLHPELDPATVVRDVRELDDLARVRYSVERLVRVAGRDVAVEGRVVAGVDLKAVNQYDIESLRGHAAVIKLPAPRVIKIEMDRAGGAEEAIRERAVSMGILDEARTNARRLIVAFLGLSGITKVEFREE
jgi:hypothetical protein